MRDEKLCYPGHSPSVVSGECVVYSERAALAGLALTGDCQSK